MSRSTVIMAVAVDIIIVRHFVDLVSRKGNLVLDSANRNRLTSSSLTGVNGAISSCRHPDNRRDLAGGASCGRTLAGDDRLLSPRHRLSAAVARHHRARRRDESRGLRLRAVARRQLQARRRRHPGALAAGLLRLARQRGADRQEPVQGDHHLGTGRGQAHAVRGRDRRHAGQGQGPPPGSRPA